MNRTSLNFQCKIRASHNTEPQKPLGRRGRNRTEQNRTEVAAAPTRLNTPHWSIRTFATTVLNNEFHNYNRINYWTGVDDTINEFNACPFFHPPNHSPAVRHPNRVATTIKFSTEHTHSGSQRMGSLVSCAISRLLACLLSKCDTWNVWLADFMLRGRRIALKRRCRTRRRRRRVSGKLDTH